MVQGKQFLEAVRRGDADAVREYLRLPDADLECRGEYGETALMLAAQSVLREHFNCQFGFPTAFRAVDLHLDTVEVSVAKH